MILQRANMADCAVLYCTYIDVGFLLFLELTGHYLLHSYSRSVVFLLGLGLVGG